MSAYCDFRVILLDTLTMDSELEMMMRSKKMNKDIMWPMNFTIGCLASLLH